VFSRVEPARDLQVIILQGSENREASRTIVGSELLEYALRRLGVTARVTTTCRLPIGAGFGMSAAALLSTITAANQVFNLGMSAQDIASCAHESEVIHRTGLGDVAACQGGGFVIRNGPGIRADIRRIFPGTCSLSAISFGPISTPSVLGSAEKMALVSSAFPGGTPVSLNDLFQLSRGFAEKSGLITPEVRQALNACDRSGVPASMTMLGNGVFALGVAARNVLSRFGRVWEFTVAESGVRLVEECI
jgi:pantoate kinase